MSYFQHSDLNRLMLVWQIWWRSHIYYTFRVCTGNVFYICCHFQLCSCSIQGSQSQQCDTVTGACTCLRGYQGFSCDHCIDGFYNFPDCRECACNRSGVIDDTCISGVCECDGMGQCFCKVTAAWEKKNSKSYEILIMYSFLFFFFFIPIRVGGSLKIVLNSVLIW